MKKYSDFISEEITIKGNPSIPGEEPGDRGPKYLSGVEEEGRRMAGGIDSQMLAMRYGREIMGLIQQNMQLMIGDIVDPQSFYSNRASRAQVERVRARFLQLEELAEELIRHHYPEILQDVELDIKLLIPSKVKEFMDEETDDDQPPKPTFRELNDPNIKKEVHKRKMGNVVMQGEAKNAKHMLHDEMVQDKIQEIYGERNAQRIFSVWDQITALADKLDWVVPIDIKADMMERQPDGFAGAVKVEWKPKPKKEEEEGQPEEEDDAQDQPEEEDNYGPCIKARGIDFPMLLHETVKGIYELISAKGIPQDKRTAEIALMNTGTFEDEAEDFRYGPKIAADLRDFINQSRNIDKYPNIREHAFGKMMEMRPDEFLPFMKGILSKSTEARTKMNEVVGRIITELDQWELRQVLPDEGGDEDQYTGDYKPEEKSKSEETDAEVDYSKMSQAALRGLIDDALDREDFVTLRKLQPFIKKNEGLLWKVYGADIKRVLKS